MSETIYFSFQSKSVVEKSLEAGGGKRSTQTPTNRLITIKFLKCLLLFSAYYVHIPYLLKANDTFLKNSTEDSYKP